MTFWDATVLGIIEGLTEFLPISSTGHLLIVEQVLSLPSTAFVKTFTIAIQTGAIVAVVVRSVKLLWGNWRAVNRVGVAFLPTAIAGVVLYRVVRGWLDGGSIVGWALVIGGIVLLAFEWWHRPRPDAVVAIESMSYRQACVIGIAQVFAFIPGVSRAGATIIGGLTVGISRATIVEFSFLLAVPTILAATTLDLVQTSAAFTLTEILLLLWGGLVSCGIALVVMRWLVRYVSAHSFAVFGWYRIVIGALVLMFS